jgi:hypothetical protein
MITITILSTGEIASFDGVISVDQSLEASVTAHPVELGAEVTDHVQKLPLRLGVDLIVTASPLGVFPQPFAVEDAIGFFERALGQLLLIVILGEGTFSSMVLAGFPHSRGPTQSRVFALRFQHVRVAASLSVAIPPRMPAPPAAAGTSTEQALGQQSTAAGAGATSVLLDIGQSTTGLAKAVGEFLF